ncbi:MAG TPA: multicopper oxidase domain-containing protein [Thermoanaerobaculia bacterium]|nr:multicopper oxidase domain-containing protein [Thermoanaerobaculia bacterium]
MIRRREVLKLGLVAGGSGLLARRAAAADPSDLLKFLCPPDGEPPDLATPSPPARPFVAPLFVPPIMQPVAKLDPQPDPRAHQRYEEFKPQKFYEIREQEFLWSYHPDPPYGDGSPTWGSDGPPWKTGSLSWGFNGSTPGPTYHARYGEAILVRRYNDLPPVGVSKVNFALPSTTSHLHNGHTASESDGQPQDWIDTGEFWDHHYPNFPSNFDPREKLTTLWYHDHRLDFTASNVYAGLDGFYCLFDDRDTGNENDPPPAWGLPSGKYDVPLILHDVMFDETGQVRWNPFNTDGILGDRYTVNRRIQPYFEVERRKYRFRILNGGPSRFYQIFLSSGRPFLVISGDGNILPRPLEAESIFLSVAQRVDIILDFSQYRVGETVRVMNRLEQTNGKGPSGRMLDPGDPLIEFRVVAATGPDPSRVPDRFREWPHIEPGEIRRERVWEFDYDGGLWTVNGKVFDPNRIDAGIEQGTAEVWIFRNGGNSWSHPIHSHFTEFLILEVNGVPFDRSWVQDWHEGEEVHVPYFDGGPKPKPIKRFMGGKRRDVATLLPGDEIKVVMRWTDFLGKYVMHCHNVVHEDHSMMVRWDIVEPGQGFVGSRPASAVYGTEAAPPHLESRPAASSFQEDQEEEREP